MVTGKAPQSWRELLGQLKCLGLSTAPKLAIGDGFTWILDRPAGCFAGQAWGARIFVEEELLTRDGHRDDIELQRATEVLKERGAAATCLEKLIDRQLLRLEHNRWRGMSLREQPSCTTEQRTKLH
jgi:hypothetical protein